MAVAANNICWDLPRYSEEKSVTEIRKVRANAKRAHTNYAKLVNSHLKSKESENNASGLINLRESLTKLRDTVFDEHRKYVAALNLPSEAAYKEDSWLLDVDDVYTSTCAAIAIRLNQISQRRDELTAIRSVIHPVPSFTAPVPAVKPKKARSVENIRPETIRSEKAFSTISLRDPLKTAKLQRKSVELEIALIKKKHDHDLKESARLAEMQAELDRERKRVDQERERLDLLARLKKLKIAEKTLEQEAYSQEESSEEEIDDDDADDDVDDESEDEVNLPSLSRNPFEPRRKSPREDPTERWVSDARVSSRKKASTPEIPAPLNDSWIQRRTNATRSRSSADAMLNLLPRHEITPFNGEPMEWPLFKAAFKDLVHDVVRSDSHRLALLRQYLSPEVQKEITNTLTNPNSYWEALEELEENYGHPHIVARAHLNNLLNIPPINENDPKSLIRFIRQVRGAVKILQSNGYVHELYSGVALGQLVEKLPKSVRSRWGRYCYDRLPHIVNIIDLESWLHKIAMGERMLNAFVPTTDKKTSSSLPDHGKHKSIRKPWHPTSPTVNHFYPKTPTSGYPHVPSTGDKKSTSLCFACKEPRHSIFKCQKFVDRSVDDRARFVKEQNRCFRCFGAGHLSSACTSKYKCATEGCNGNHHTLLHGAHKVFATPERTTDAKPKPDAQVNSLNLSQNTTLLGVVKVRVASEKTSIETWALLDPGATVSLIREDIANVLNLKGPAEKVQFGTFNGTGPLTETRRVSFKISPYDDQKDSLKVVDALSVPALNVTRRSALNWTDLCGKWEHLSDLPCHVVERADVAVLIGMDVVPAHLQLEVRVPPSSSNAPHAVRTRLGWSIVGPVSNQFDSIRVNHLHLNSEDVNLQEMVKNLWRTESLATHPNIQSSFSKDEKRAVSLVDASTVFNGERYEAGLPWKSDAVYLPDNYSAAYNRLLSVERKFAKNPEFATVYESVIDGYVKNNFAVKVPPAELNSSPDRVWYVPHHGVTNPLKPGKVRVVFDASAEFKGTSLNKELLCGPNLLRETIEIITLFRQRAVPVTADITAFFHQVGVRKSDQSCLRYLWRPPGSKSQPEVFKMTRQIFGAISSPFVCSFVLRKMAEDNRKDFPTTADRVAKNFYVDNYLDSFDTEEEALQECPKLAALLERGGFHLSQWLSTSRRLLASFPSADLISPDVNLDLDNLPIERTLGIRWSAETDAFSFKVKFKESATTKRKILSQAASVYDPLGFLAPVIFTVKRLLQDIWRSGSDWDSPVDPDILQNWQEWTSKIPLIEQLSIPRSFTRESIREIELHAFGDASELGFGAVLYLRYPKGDSFVVKFIASKTRVAPIKPLSIPRLELQGALIAFRLASTFAQVLEFHVNRITYWSDSTTVLQWLKSRKCRLQSFVSNRVGEILEKSDPSQWRHVPGKENPADDCTRGVSPEILTTDHRWFTGPDFLLKTENEWPIQAVLSDPSPDDPEVSLPTWIGTLVKDTTQPLTEFIKRASSLRVLKRIVGWILRFVNQCKKQEKRSNRLLDVIELSNAFIACVRVSQEESFPEEIECLRRKRPLMLNSRLANLTPFVDEHGILRVGGRLGRSSLPFDSKHPILLGSFHPLTDLIIRDLHLSLLHSSNERLLSEIRLNYWIIGSRRAIKRVVRSCFACQRSKAKPCPPLMAPLPPERLTPFQRPFTDVALDYFGPLTVVIGRRTEKRYVCLFTCMATRAVHLEVVSSLDVDSFLLGFRRFVARRGKPKTVFSDNGTNLVAGEKEMREQLENWNREKLEKDHSDLGITWKFSPPSGPHFGGVWERIVRSCKTPLRLVLQNRTVSDEVLQTVITEVEALLNGRPLTHLGVDPDDPLPLTPNHFLIGQAVPRIPSDILAPEEMTSKRRWRAAQAIVDQFWRRWMKEYVPSLIERRKWLRHRRNLKIGDVVIVVEPNTPRGLWPLGRIVQPLPGPDGIVRAARVRTKMGEKVRPVAKLCLLEEADGKD